MKKNNLFKVVGLTILVLVLLSWLVPIVYSIAGIKLTGEETVSTQIGFIGLINVVLETFSGFGGVIVFILLVGGFYGVLKATGAYDKVLDFLSEKASGKEKCALITTMIVMALVSSIAGLDLGLLVVFPLLLGLLVKIGYDKIVALSATFGATIIGMYGSTLSGTMYGTNNTLLGLKKFSQITPKIVLFVLGLSALIFMVVKYCESKKLVFDEKSARKTILIEGIVLFGMGLIASSVLFFANVLSGSLTILMIVLPIVLLLAVLYSVLRLSNNNLLVVLVTMFALVFAFSLVLVILYAAVKSVASVLWIVISSVSLIAIIVLTVLLIKKHKKNVTKKKESKKLSKNDNRKSKVIKKSKGERGALPGLVILGIVLLIMFLGTTSWGNIFKSNWFETAHASWTSFKIGGFEILNKLFGGLDAFGTWTTINRFQTYSVILIIAIVALKFVYKTNWVDVRDGFLDGLKSFIVPAILAVLACSLFVLVFYNPFLSVVTKNLLTATKDFNVVLTGIYTIINSVFYVDYYYLSNSLLYGVTSIYDDTTVLSVLSVMFTNLYSLVMLIAPSSVLLLVSLSISDVKYSDWFKFIWKLVGALFIISFVVFTAMVLI